MSERLKTPLVVIVGPTASGKSQLALDVAKRHSGELICADSRTVYRGMDIGTAKPTQEERQLVPHHMLDVVQPDERFTVVDFKRLASSYIDDIAQRHKLPIMVGGTGLYIDSIIFDYVFGRNGVSSKRAQLESLTVEEMHVICRLSNIDIPENSQNKRHLIRAIELGGLTKQNKHLRPNTLVVGIKVDTNELRRRIEQRANMMLKQGILQELATLGASYGWQNEAMTANIYRVFREVVEGTKTEQEALTEVVRSDMALVKRQATWFKRNPYIVWGSPPKLVEVIDEFLRRPISS